jgi:flagellar assembly factor FliW
MPHRTGPGVITFGDGLPGFEAFHQFVLVRSPSIDPFTLVKGIGTDAPSFLAVDPLQIHDHYTAELTGQDLARLGADAGKPLLWLALVSAGADQVTVNLRAPIVINPETMRGIQLLSAESAYPVDYPLRRV